MFSSRLFALFGALRPALLSWCARTDQVGSLRDVEEAHVGDADGPCGRREEAGRLERHCEVASEQHAGRGRACRWRRQQVGRRGREQLERAERTGGRAGRRERRLLQCLLLQQVHLGAHALLVADRNRVQRAQSAQPLDERQAVLVLPRHRVARQTHLLQRVQALQLSHFRQALQDVYYL